jgi:hypothetical protein
MASGRCLHVRMYDRSSERQKATSAFSVHRTADTWSRERESTVGNLGALLHCRYLQWFAIQWCLLLINMPLLKCRPVQHLKI